VAAARKTSATKTATRAVAKRAAKKTAASKPPKLARRACGAMQAHMRLLETNPSFRGNQFKLEGDIAKLRTSAINLRTVPIATIKVIVHVVWNTPEQNISDAQIKSQIAALNKDFRATNPDKSKTPTPWKSLVADARVNFVLHAVTRTQTTKASFSDNDGVKKASTGGKAPVDTTKFLNVWVCNLADGLLGYAQFPGGPKSSDGVVMLYSAFGTVGAATAPFNKGRTATHEIGHYLNLRHIWGDTPDCSGTDMVPDTPNAAGPNFNKPAFPVVTCNNGPNGDMFMNYMDYVDDAAMFMFTAQQVLRMRATLNGPRRKLW
jgi:Pregnancy-associated plasma protein-A